MVGSLQAVTSGNAPAPLSAELRARTAAPHRRLESALGLPHSIVSTGDYADWLGRFLGLYEPLEGALGCFRDWPSFGPAARIQSQSARIRSDLAAMGVDARAMPRASTNLLPALPTFPHAVGALYVIEGAKLGGRIILRDLDARLGAGIAGARSFFGSQGTAVPPDWNAFRAALDRFGSGRPRVRGDVVLGAERTFEAMRVWFHPLCAAPEMPS